MLDNRVEIDNNGDNMKTKVQVYKFPVDLKTWIKKEVKRYNKTVFPEEISQSGLIVKILMEYRAEKEKEKEKNKNP